MAYFPDPPKFEFGSSGAGAGTAATVVPIYEPTADDRFEATAANANLLAGRIELEDSFTADTDHETLLPRYQASLDELTKKTAESIRNPHARTLFVNSTAAEHGASGIERMTLLAEKRRTDALLADTNARLDRLRAAALKSPDETQRTTIIDAASGLIGAAGEKGLLTPEQQKEWSRRWAENYALQSFKAKPAQEQRDLARGFLDGKADAATSPFALIPPERWQGLHREAERDATIARIRTATEKAEKWTKLLDEAADGATPLPPVADIDNDADLDARERETLRLRYDQVAGEKAVLDNAVLRFNASGPFDPSDDLDGKNTERLFRLLGSDEIAAKAVLHRTGILPETGAQKFPKLLEGAIPSSTLLQLASNDPSFVPAKLPPDAQENGPRVDEKGGDRAGQDVGEVPQQPQPLLLAQNTPAGQLDANIGTELNEWKKHPFEELIEKNKTINDIIEREAKAAGVNPRWLKIIAYIESRGGQQNDKGSYVGLFQFGDDAWKDFGGGKRTDPVDSTRAAIKEFEINRGRFLRRFGREPNLGEMYLMHQQGWAGALSHLRNPQGLAWQNLKGATRISEEKAKLRIWSNLSDELKPVAHFMTSQDFMDYWTKKVEGGEGYRNWFAAFPAKPIFPMQGVAVDKLGVPADQHSVLLRSNQRVSAAEDWQASGDRRTLSVMRNAIATDTKLRNAEKVSK